MRARERENNEASWNLYTIDRQFKFQPPFYPINRILVKDNSQERLISGG